MGVWPRASEDSVGDDLRWRQIRWVAFALSLDAGGLAPRIVMFTSAIYLLSGSVCGISPFVVHPFPLTPLFHSLHSSLIEVYCCSCLLNFW